MILFFKIDGVRQSVWEKASILSILILFIRISIKAALTNYQYDLNTNFEKQYTIEAVTKQLIVFGLKPQLIVLFRYDGSY